MFQDICQFEISVHDPMFHERLEAIKDLDQVVNRLFLS
jgi:hypothetical protein